MKILFAHCCFLLLVTQSTSTLIHANNISDDIKPVDILNYYSKATLTIQANVYFGDQDEVTVPIKTDFYLLDKDFVSILKENKLKPVSEDRKLPTKEDYLSATAHAFLNDDEESGIISLLISKAITMHRVAGIKTDELGNGKTKTISAGNYYLFGISRVEDEVLVWNQLVQIKPGQNKIEIDQHNSDFVYEIN